MLALYGLQKEKPATHWHQIDYNLLLINQGSKEGAVVRALTSHQCGLGSMPSWCYSVCGLSLLLVLALLPLFFSRYSCLPSSAKTNISYLEFDKDGGPAWKPTKADVAFSLNIEIWFYFVNQSTDPGTQRLWWHHLSSSILIRVLCTQHSITQAPLIS